MRSIWNMPLSAAALLVLAGCHHEHHEQAKRKPVRADQPAPSPTYTTVPPPQQQWTDEPMIEPAAPVLPVKEGALPLVYLVESGAMIRVSDLQTQENLLRVPVAAHTLVAVDGKSGVRVGSAVMRFGPLPTDHRYGIFVEKTESSVYRHGQFRPGQAGGSSKLPPAPASPQPQRTP